MPSPRTTVTSPYRNFLDINSKDQKMLWCKMVKPSNDHVLLDLTVSNSKAIVDLFQDKAITYRWMRFMHIPTDRTGAISPTLKCSSGSKDIFHANLSNFKNLIEDFNHITLEQVMAFASWFMVMGDYGQLLVGHPLTNMKMKYIDVNAPGNSGLIASFKQECCSVSCLVWNTIKNHLTMTSYKALLVCKKEFAYECNKTGDITYEGFTLLSMIYIVDEPNVVVDVKDLQNKMEKMTLITCDNNFKSLTRSLEELQQEINAKKGKDFLKDDKLLTKLFCAAKTTTNKLFAINVSLAMKTAWITGKQTDKNSIIQDSCILYRNSVADGSWSWVSSADSKIIALTTQVKSLQDKLNKASSGKVNLLKKSNKHSKLPLQKDQDPMNKWCYTKVGETTKDPTTGATLKWCPHHRTGAYMPQDHNHQKWLEKRKRKNTKWDNNKANKCVKFSSDAEKMNPASKPQPVKDENHLSKLQLSTSLRQSLITYCVMMPTEADTVLDEAFGCAMDLS
jgi:hypothetical protein